MSKKPPTPVTRNPMLMASELYQRVCDMAERRHFAQHPEATELMTALFLASCILQQDDQVARTRVMRRIQRQALAFIEIGVLKEVKDEETPDPDAVA